MALNDFDSYRLVEPVNGDLSSRSVIGFWSWGTGGLVALVARNARLTQF
jgi:hypothetical protein